MALARTPTARPIAASPSSRIADPGGGMRAILFGYACHGTTIAGGKEFSSSPATTWHTPGAQAPSPAHGRVLGCGADGNPSPRGKLANAKQHGLELAGAVAGVLAAPCALCGRPRCAAPGSTAAGALAHAGEALGRAADKDPYVQTARAVARMLDGERAAPSRELPHGRGAPGRRRSRSFFLAGEVVADYAIRMKRELAGDHPWTVGYAFEVPCYIPIRAHLKEGGYEADTSLIYYGIRTGRSWAVRKP